MNESLFTCVQQPLQSFELTYQKAKSNPDTNTITVWPVAFAAPAPALGPSYENYTHCRWVFMAPSLEVAKQIQQTSTIDGRVLSGWGTISNVFYFINVPDGKTAADVEQSIAAIVMGSLMPMAKVFIGDTPFTEIVTRSAGSEPCRGINWVHDPFSQDLDDPGNIVPPGAPAEFAKDAINNWIITDTNFCSIGNSWIHLGPDLHLVIPAGAGVETPRDTSYFGLHSMENPNPFLFRKGKQYPSRVQFKEGSDGAYESFFKLHINGPYTGLIRTLPTRTVTPAEVQALDTKYDLFNFFTDKVTNDAVAIPARVHFETGDLFYPVFVEGSLNARGVAANGQGKIPSLWLLNPVDKYFTPLRSPGLEAEAQPSSFYLMIDGWTSAQLGDDVLGAPAQFIDVAGSPVTALPDPASPFTDSLSHVLTFDLSKIKCLSFMVQNRISRPVMPDNLPLDELSKLVSTDGCVMNSYLAPYGSYLLNGPARLMSGLNGQDFLYLEVGDRLKLFSTVSQLNVHTGGPGPKYRVLTRTAAPQVVSQQGINSTAIGTSWCAQAEGFTAYLVDTGTAPYLNAVGLQIVPFKTDTPAFHPMMPYRDALKLPDQPTNYNGETGVPLLEDQADVIEDYEHNYLNWYRWLLQGFDRQNFIGTATLGNVLPMSLRKEMGQANTGPVFFALDSGKQLVNKTLRTPQGFLLQTDPQGGINSLTIGYDGTNKLSFNRPSGAAVLTPENDAAKFDFFAYSLAAFNQPLIVMTGDSWFGNSIKNLFPQTRVKVGDFSFNLDLTAQQGKRTPIMLMKLRSGAALVNPDLKPEQYDSWPLVTSAPFVTPGILGDAKAWSTDTAFAKSYDLISYASGGEGPITLLVRAALKADLGTGMYGLRTLLTDPDWTGVIFFNCPLDVAKLPMDIQMLLAGIEGDLLATYVAINQNAVNNGVMQPSAISALIHYDAAELADKTNYDDNGLSKYFKQKDAKHFQTLLLDAEFQNSQLTHFACQVAFSIPELFSESVSLDHDPAYVARRAADLKQNPLHRYDVDENKVIVLDGKYVKEHGSQSGHVVFDSTDPRIFKPGGNGKIINSFTTNDIKFVPVSSVPNGDTITVVSQFSLSGALDFNSPDTLDLFSFDHLSVTGYYFTITSLITLDTTADTYQASVHGIDEVDLANLVVSTHGPTGPVKPRSLSLLATMPWKVAGWKHYPNGITAAGLSGLNVSIDNLSSANTGSEMNFALVLTTTLGSLGRLAKAGSVLNATMYLGWSSTGQLTDSNQVMAVLIPPNGMSTQGTFKMQGVINCTFNKIKLSTVGATKASQAFVLTLTDVTSKVFGIPLAWSAPSKGSTDLTFFAAGAQDPNNPQLFWSLHDPRCPPLVDPNAHAINRNKRRLLGGVGGGKAALEPPPTRTDSTRGFARASILKSSQGDNKPTNTHDWGGSASGDVSFTSYAGHLSGIYVKTDPGSVDVLETALGYLLGLDLNVIQLSQDVTKGVLPQNVIADPTAGMMVYFYLDLVVVQAMGLFNDGEHSFYGGKFGFGLRPPEKPLQTWPTDDQINALEEGESFADGKVYKAGDPLPKNPDYIFWRCDNGQMRYWNSGSKQVSYYTGQINDTFGWTGWRRLSDQVDYEDRQYNDGWECSSHEDAPPPKKQDIPKKKGTGDSLLSQLDGLAVTIIYRKLSETLGEWSVGFTPPKKLQSLSVGETLKLGIPYIGVNVWTDKSWLLLLGWPITDSTIPKLSLTVPVEGIPLTGSIAVKLGVMNGSDFPGKYQGYFDRIVDVGLGVSLGVAFKKQISVLSLSLSITAGLAFEANFNNTYGHLGAPNYCWLCGTAFVAISIDAKIDLRVITASLTVSATVTLTLAVESYHSTHLHIEVVLAAKFKLKIVFITLSISYSFTYVIYDGDIGGNGPKALSDGPSPSALDKATQQSIGFAPSVINKVAAAHHAVFTGRRMMGNGGGTPTTRPLSDLLADWINAARPGSVMKDGRYVLPAFFAVQPTTVSDGSTWTPKLVSSLLMQAGTLNTSTNTFAPGSFAFQDLLKRVLVYFLNEKATTMLVVTPANLAEIATAVKTLEAEIQPPSTATDATTLTTSDLTSIFDGCYFTLAEATNAAFPVTSTSQVEGVVLPMFPELGHTYNKQVTSYDAEETRHLQLDYFDLLVRHSVHVIGQILKGKVENKVGGGLTTADWNVLVQEMAGFMCRFFQNGPRWQGDSAFVATKQEFTAVTTALEVDFNGPATAVPHLSLSGVTTVKHSFDAALVFPAQLDPWHGVKSPLEIPAHAPAENPTVVSGPRIYQLKPGHLFNGPTSYRLNFLPQHLLDDLAQRTPGSQTQHQAQIASFKAPSAPGQAPVYTLLDSSGVKFAMVLPLVTSPAGSISAGPVFEVGALNDDLREQLGGLLTASKNSACITDGYLATLSNITQHGSSTGAAATFAPVTATITRTNVSTTEVTSDLSDSPFSCQLQTTKNTADDVHHFMRLVWEAAVVNATGYHVCVETSVLDGSKPITPYLVLMLDTSTPEMWKYVNSVLVSTATNFSPRVDTPIVAIPVSDLAKTADDIPSKALPHFKTQTPAGAVDFSFELAAADDPALPANANASQQQQYAATMYHLFQSRVYVTNMEAEAGWSAPIGHRNEDGNKNWLYSGRQVLTNSSNPYDIIGNKSIVLQFRTLDMFGNALPELFTWSLPVRKYTDPLLGVSNWHNVSITWEVVAGPALQLHCTYAPHDDLNQPAATAQNVTALSNLDKAKLLFTQIDNQLSDQKVTVGLTSQLLGAGSGQPNGSLLGGLRIFVETVQSYLNKLKAGDKVPDDTVITSDIQVPLEMSDVENLPDLFELRLELFIKRPASLVDTTAATRVPELVQVSTVIMPDISNPLPAADGVAQTNVEKNSHSMQAFAAGLESAYRNFDHKSANLKLAQGPKQDSLPGHPHSLWAFKWVNASNAKGSPGGVRVTFPAPAPRFLAPIPLSRRLLNLNAWLPSVQASTFFSNVALDDWGHNFLEELRLLMSPERATQLAKISRSGFRTLMLAKYTLGLAVANQLDNVLANQDKPSHDEQNYFAENLFTSLGSDYNTSVMVSMTARVDGDQGIPRDDGVTNDPNPPDPSLLGKIAVDTTSDDAKKSFTFSNASLPLPALPGNSNTHFLVSSRHPQTKSSLELKLDYRTTAFDYRFHKDEERYGFIPSTWLHFVLPANENDSDALLSPIGDCEIPLPIRSFPGTPQIFALEQVASAKPQDIQSALKWSAKVSVSLPEAAQDEVFLYLNFSEATTNAQTNTIQPDAKPEPANLFEALAQFRDQYPAWKAKITDPVQLSKLQKQDVKTIAGLFKTVAGKWKTLPDATEDNLPVLGREDLRLKITYDADTQQVTVVPVGSKGKPKPLPAGMTITSAKSTTLNAVDITINGLTLLSHQTLDAYAFTQRNTELVNGVATNPDFIYQTPLMKFPSKLVPYVESAQEISIDKSTLTEALKDFFDAMTDEFTGKLQFSLAVGNSLIVSLPAGNGNALTATAPLFFSEVLGTVDATGAILVNAANYRSSLKDQVINSQGPSKGAYTQEVSLGLVIFSSFSETLIPILRLSNITMSVSGGSNWFI